MINKLPDQLLGGRLLVKVLRSEEFLTEKGIVIPETANSNLSEALVVKIDKAFEHLIPVGNIVVYPTGSGVAQYVKNDAHLWLNIQDVWGTFSMDQE